MNLVEYLHFQARTGTYLLSSEKHLSATSLLSILTILNQPMCVDYLRQYSSPSSIPTSETDDAVVTNEMAEFFRSGTVPLSFLFEKAQRQFGKQVARQVEKQLKGDHVQTPTEESHEELRTDVSNRVVGIEFKLKLARKFCFLMDALFWVCNSQSRESSGQGWCWGISVLG